MALGAGITGAGFWDSSCGSTIRTRFSTVARAFASLAFSTFSSLAGPEDRSLFRRVELLSVMGLLGFRALFGESSGFSTFVGVLTSGFLLLLLLKMDGPGIMVLVVVLAIRG